MAFLEELRRFWRICVKLSSKARYAVMAMVDIAHYGEAEPVSLSAISIRQDLPLAYLEQLFNKLKKAGLVISCRGATGGYKLSQSRADIHVYNIIAAVDTPLKATRCSSDHSGCQISGTKCMTHDLWGELTAVVAEFLKKITLDDICARRVKGLTSQLFERAA